MREVVKISASYKLASRAFRPDGTIVKVGPPGNQIEVGGRDVVMMAGPCTVESAEQIMTIAGIMKENGIRVLRGGAFKPRTSPYSFQGMGEEGLKVLKELAKVRKPVLLKRGPSATIEEWLLSAEYIMTGGNHSVMLCERGIRTFE